MKGCWSTLLFIALVLFSCDNYNDISTSQSDSFVKNYTINQNNAGTGVCKLSDGGYALLGNTESVARGTDICLMITDEFGNSIQKAKIIGTAKNDRGYCIKQSPDGGFIILGSRQDETDDDLDVYLIRTDRLGDTLWTRSFDERNKADEGLWFDTDDNGNIMMVGYTTNTIQQAWHFLVDQHGDTVNSYESKELGTIPANEARYVKRFNDGWLVAGTLDNIPLWLITNDYRFEINYVSDRYANEKANSVTLLDDNTYLVCGTVSDGTGGSDVLLIKIKKVISDKIQYERVWQRSFSNPGNDKGTCILTQDNQIHILSTLSNGDKSSIISIITTDLDGENPQYKSFGGSSLMKSSNFEFTEDGGFIISGTNERNFKSSLMMIKTKTGGVL